MPTTAYSRFFQRELDPEQLLALLQFDISSDPDFKNLPVELRNWIYNDVVCPECGASGCVIVSRAKSKRTNISLRQPHFRFLADDGISAHHPLCDNFDNSERITKQDDLLIDFGQDQTAETKIIRELVAKGIEQQIFSQQTIREMRQWFFDTKVNNQFVMDLPESSYQSISILLSLSHLHGIPFKPIHAELPNFDWHHAAKLQFVSENGPLLEIFRSRWWGFYDKVAKRTLTIIKKFNGKNAFDVRALGSHYKMTIELASFAARNLCIYGQNEQRVLFREQDIRLGIAKSTLLAFAALLLYVSNWNIDDAISNLVTIVKGSAPTDLNHGNIIGLNPFYDFIAWANIMQAIEIGKSNNNKFDFEAQINSIR